MIKSIRAERGPVARGSVRAAASQVTAVDGLLADQANPQNPNSVDVSRPSAALTVQADDRSLLTAVFAGLTEKLQELGNTGDDDDQVRKPAFR